MECMVDGTVSFEADVPEKITKLLLSINPDATEYEILRSIEDSCDESMKAFIMLNGIGTLCGAIMEAEGETIQ